MKTKPSQKAISSSKPPHTTNTPESRVDMSETENDIPKTNRKKGGKKVIEDQEDVGTKVYILSVQCRRLSNKITGEHRSAAEAPKHDHTRLRYKSTPESRLVFQIVLPAPPKEPTSFRNFTESEWFISSTSCISFHLAESPHSHSSASSKPTHPTSTPSTAYNTKEDQERT